ncbi:hypothetical protein JKP88DRAFT_264065 [Tribonema minus]|uniref:Glutathione S-transferase n=1 Tax=Tribonema minus TaxID=303371 RepID=A0A836CC62_9STRA|nr:hypothetical protein JKP88DRAFT_264065 [Tribonema minus]
MAPSYVLHYFDVPGRAEAISAVDKQLRVITIGGCFDDDCNLPVLNGFHCALVLHEFHCALQPIRLTLAITGTEFEDHRIAREDWLDFKAKGPLPYGQVPVLEPPYICGSPARAGRQPHVCTSLRYDTRKSGERLGFFEAAPSPRTAPPARVKGDDGATTIIAETSAILGYIVAAHGAAAGMQRADPLEAARVEEFRSAIDSLGAKLSATMYEKDEARKMAARAELAATTLPKGLAAIDARLQDSGYASGDTVTVADIAVSEAVRRVESGVLEGIPTDLAAPYARIAKCAANVRGHPRVVAWHKSREAAA